MGGRRREGEWEREKERERERERERDGENPMRERKVARGERQSEGTKQTRNDADVKERN